MSITLTTPYTISVNGTQVENDTIGACVSMSMDYNLRMMTYVFQVGTLTGNPPNLSPGAFAQVNQQTVTVAVYVGPTQNGQTTGQWYLNGVLKGTIIPGVTINPIITQLLANRNTAEGFVSVVGGLMPGTAVTWTQL